MILSAVTGHLVHDGESARKNLPLYKKAGFDAIDYSFFSIHKNADIYDKKTYNEVFDLPHDEMLAFFKQIRDVLQECDMRVGQTHAPFPSKVLSEGFDDANEYTRTVIEKCIEVTAFLGCRYIIVHPIFKKYDSNSSYETEFEDNIKFYSNFIPTLKKFGVVMCLENMWVRYKGKIYSAVCGDFEEVNRYIDTLNAIAGEELFGFCYDSGHSTICSADPCRAIKTLGKNIKAVHLHEVDGVNDSHTIPFFGVTDWERLLKALSDIGYSGTLNFETYKVWDFMPKEVLPETLALLGSIGRYFVKKYF